MFFIKLTQSSGNNIIIRQKRLDIYVFGMHSLWGNAVHIFIPSTFDMQEFWTLTLPPLCLCCLMWNGQSFAFWKKEKNSLNYLVSNKERLEWNEMTNQQWHLRKRMKPTLYYARYLPEGTEIRENSPVFDGMHQVQYGRVASHSQYGSQYYFDIMTVTLERNSPHIIQGQNA